MRLASAPPLYLNTRDTTRSAAPQVDYVNEKETKPSIVRYALLGELRCAALRCAALRWAGMGLRHALRSCVVACAPQLLRCAQPAAPPRAAGALHALLHKLSRASLR